MQGAAHWLAATMACGGPSVTERAGRVRTDAASHDAPSQTPRPREPLTPPTRSSPTAEEPTAPAEFSPSKTGCVFEDREFEAMVRRLSGKAEGDIAPSDVAGIESMAVPGGVESLDGIQCLTRLTELDL